MKISVFAFVVILVVASALAEHIAIEKFLSSFSNRENVLYVILDCEENNLRTAIELFAGLRTGTSDGPINIIVIPLDNGTIKPSIFTESLRNVDEIFENYACLSNMGKEERYDKSNIESVITQILPRMQQGDSIILIVAFEDRKQDKFSSSLLEKLLQKQISVNVVTAQYSYPPNEYVKLTKTTEGNVLTYSPQMLQSSKLNTKKDRMIRKYALPNYEISVTKKEMRDDTRTQFMLPKNTFRIFLTLYGEIKKALLISPSGAIINVLPADDEYTPVGQNRSVNFDLMILKSPTIWTLSASGNRYHVTLMMLTNTERKSDHLSSDNSNTAIEKETEVARSIESPMAMKQKSSNVRTLTKRQDILEPTGLSIYGQSSINTLGNSHFNTFPTTIDVDPQSTLFVLPGEEAVIIFNIKNNKPIVSDYVFHCIYPQNRCIVVPMRVTLIPHQSINVLVRVQVEGTEGSSSVLTFISEDVETVYRKIYLYTGRQRSDTTKPDIDYEYNGNCDDANTGNTCNRKRWSAEVTARDTGTGLLNFWSEPPGLLYTSEFIVGTRDPVSGRYSASCCEPKVDILASDLKGNTHRVTLDVQHQYLNWVEITAIVLAAILLILLIAIVIFLVLRWRRRRNERSFLDN